MSEENDAVDREVFEEVWGQYFDEPDYEPDYEDYDGSYYAGYAAGFDSGYEQARSERLLPRLRSWFWRIRHDWRMRKYRREMDDIPF